jgi:delta1-piperideine-2-carboxylate reductase
MAHLGEVEGSVKLAFEELVSLLERIFVTHGVSPANAKILAENCAACERDGSLSHGIFRISGYVSSLQSGWVDGAALPVVEDTGGAFIRVDAKNGFAQPALIAARAMLVERTRQYGIALLALRRSHHFSALWPDVEPFADEGLVALSFVNSMACVVPHGGHKAVFGTNPIAFAAPAGTSRLSSLTRHPARSPMATSRSPPVKAGCSNPAWASTVTVIRPAIQRLYWMAALCCPSADTRAIRSR